MLDVFTRRMQQRRARRQFAVDYALVGPRPPALAAEVEEMEEMDKGRGGGAGKTAVKMAVDGGPAETGAEAKAARRAGASSADAGDGLDSAGDEDDDDDDDEDDDEDDVVTVGGAPAAADTAAAGTLRVFARCVRAGEGRRRAPTGAADRGSRPAGTCPGPSTRHCWAPCARSSGWPGACAR